MTGEEIAVWLSNIYGGAIELKDIEGVRIAFVTLGDDTRTATTCGFSQVDTGLALQDDKSTDVRCEIVIQSDSASDEELAAALIGLWGVLARAPGTIPAQPGTSVPNAVVQSPLAAVPEVTVKHAVLREPQIFDQGTPSLSEEGRITLLLEAVLLTDEEFGIVQTQGMDRVSTRLRRRATNLGDFRRDAD
ncbi:suppressor of fused domain protein [Corynebacterium breve]|uniref:Suppressor of fused domain protein n=1 Tax=Corynebacterium breve TaxID=3049799 RepID=A0ABY8VEG4_9CORY|nr:suppressor of fused domain protein [Corynebacterium breve]WIM67903.1 suppressor of fused domain protein [Corynebacterium breve]